MSIVTMKRQRDNIPVTNVRDKTVNATMVKPMGKAKFQNINWKIGDLVKLTNSKIYSVISLDIDHNSLILHSDEYNTDFKADCRIISDRVKQRIINCFY